MTAARGSDGVDLPPVCARAEGTGAIAWRDVAQMVGVFERIGGPAPRAQAVAALEGGATGLVLRPADLPDVLDIAPAGTAALRFEGVDDPAAVLDALAAACDRHGAMPDAVALDLGLDPVAATSTILPAVSLARRRGFTGPIVRADGLGVHAAGAAPAQELGAVLATGLAALRALHSLGLEDARRALSFALAAETDEIVTIAKFRALRRLWARVENACALSPEPIRLHAETARRMLASRDAPTNIVRNTVAAAGAILGGADSLTVLPHTAALGPADEGARRLARNSALVLLEEAGLGRIADPAAGSGTFEHATDALARAAWAQVQAIERAGGMAAMLKDGSFASAIAASAAARQAALDAGETVLVGVTRYLDPAEAAA